MLPKWFTPIAVAAVAGLSIWLLSDQAPQKSRLIALDDTVADTLMENVTTYIFDEKGKPRHEIHASHMAHFPTDDHSKFTSLQFTLYQSNDQQWDVSAKQGTTNNGIDEIILSGKVVMHRRKTSTGDSNLQINTTKLLIRPNDSYAETDQLITITSDKHSLKSNGIRAYFNDGRVELLSRVKGEYVL